MTKDKELLEQAKADILAKMVANDIVLNINLPSELRLRFGTEEQIAKATEEYKRVLDEHNKKQDKLQKQLEALDNE